MSFSIISAGLRPSLLWSKVLKISVSGTLAQKRDGGRYIKPKLRYPEWYLKQHRVKYDEMLTPENKEFIKEVIHDTYGPPAEVGGVQTYLHSPLKKEPILRGTWYPNCRRCGLIGIKIGIMSQWKTDGKHIFTTLIQIVDNHVIRYIPPEEFVLNKERRKNRKFKRLRKMGCLVVGAVNSDPQLYTKDYNSLFDGAGVMPKKILTRFPIDPCAAIQPGTPLYASHFKVSDYVDVSGVTVDRGFQGVMKRWGFHGQPASHGQTKTHRRPGNIGGGGEKARVWPGKKMPGVMGNKLRTLRGLKIWKIDNKYNVLYVSGGSVPGDNNSFVYIHDTVLPSKKLKEAPHFPTYYPEDHEEPRPDEEYDPMLFNFSNPTIIFEEEKVQKKKK